MKKKAIVVFASAIIACVAFSGAAGYAIGKNEVIAILAQHLNITNEGRVIDTGDDTPLLYNNKTYLPVRAVSEALGYDVEWFSDSSTVNLSLPENAYPIIKADGIEIIDVSPSLNLMSATVIQSATVVVEQTKQFEHEPVLVLEVLRNGIVVDSQTEELETSPGRYTVEIKSSQFNHQLRNMESEERLEKYNEQYSFRLKII